MPLYYFFFFYYERSREGKRDDKEKNYGKLGALRGETQAKNIFHEDHLSFVNVPYIFHLHFFFLSNTQNCLFHVEVKHNWPTLGNKENREKK